MLSTDHPPPMPSRGVRLSDPWTDARCRRPAVLGPRRRVRRELRTLLPLEVAALEARIAELERELELARLAFDRELALLRQAAGLEG